MFNIDGARVELIASAVIVPGFAVTVMSILEQLVDKTDWRIRVTKLGFDLCVLTMGVVGGIFSNAAIVEAFKTKGLPGLIEAMALLMTFAVALGIMFIRRQQTPTGKLAFVALGMGGSALAIPIYIAVTF